MENFLDQTVNSGSGAPGAPRVGGPCNTSIPPVTRDRRRRSSRKRWCFTFPNPTDAEITRLVGTLTDKCSHFVFQEEVGEGGLVHLQGVCAFYQKTRRPTTRVPWTTSIHWEACRNWDASIAYCSDPDKRSERNIFHHLNLPIARTDDLMVDTINRDDFYDWQNEVVDIVSEAPDDRCVYWYWDRYGNVGKSALCKWLVVHMDAIILSGKGADIKHGIADFVSKNGKPPQIVLYDVPRTSLQFVNYATLEEVKNGLFFSGKYESGMCVIPNPHVICFANEPPKTENMSADRWEIVEVVGPASQANSSPKRRRIAWNGTLDEPTMSVWGGIHSEPMLTQTGLSQILVDSSHDP